MPSINIPFPGFYESLLSGELDSVEERHVEYAAEEHELEHPEHLRLDARELGEVLFDTIDYAAAHQYLAREYVASADHILSDELGFPVRLKFEEMTSPKFYNFETDRVFVNVPWRTVAMLKRISLADCHATLAATIKERHTSYDGFHSFYSNDLAEWLAKPMTEWDHNELGTLLRAVMTLKGIGDRASDDGLEWRVYYHMSDSNDFDTAFDRANDWAKYDEKLAELRADKASEWAEIHPDETPPTYRCPLTLDMFQPGA